MSRFFLIITLTRDRLRILRILNLLSVTVAARSKARNVFPHSNTGIMCSNPTSGMNIWDFSVFVLFCIGSGLATGSSPILQTVGKNVRFIVLRLVLNGDRPGSLIRLGRS
jgi:hypothetical protein